jgi:Protein of unknown function (DUF2950)
VRVALSARSVVGGVVFAVACASDGGSTTAQTAAAGQEVAFVASAAAPYQGQGKVGDPYRGYYFFVLTQQGAHPPGGAYNYVISGNMIAGFALMAFPAEYGTTGVMSFLVSHQGQVYQKDLGSKTQELTGAIKAYDPDDSWTRVPDDE